METNNVTPQFVWFDEHGQGTDLYAEFRLRFVLPERPTSASLCLFADTVYQLFVNGSLVHAGPGRFDPRYPVYDEVDLASFLKPGKQEIRVRVRSYGYSTFRSIPCRAGFLAWGTIAWSTGEVDLTTGLAPWFVRRMTEYRRPTLKLSFALPGAEDYGVGATIDQWLNAVLLSGPFPWGPLTARSLPLLTTEASPFQVLAVRPLKADRGRWFRSFATPTPGTPVAVELVLQSPREQTVVLNQWFGDVLINGKPATALAGITGNGFHNRWACQLKQGANFYQSKGKSWQEVSFHYLSVAAEAGVELVAETCSLPTADSGGSPALETLWDDYRLPVEEVKAEELARRSWSRDFYPDGYCLQLDLGAMNLGFPHLEAQGSPGTVIDVVYADRWMPDLVHPEILSWVPLADRLTLEGSTLDWMPLEPRGARFVTITVRGRCEEFRILRWEWLGQKYPAARVGRFSCSDALLTSIWEMGRRTLEINTEDAYDDCVNRERGMYIRDTVIQHQIDQAISGDNRLFRRSLELWSQSNAPDGKFRAVFPHAADYTIADFGLNAVEAFATYARLTGDLGLIKQAWTSLRSNLAWFDALADEHPGLLLDGAWHVKRQVKDMYGGWHGDNGLVAGYLDKTGPSCGFSCFYLMALRAFADLARQVGEADDLAHAQKRIDRLEASIPQAFWDGTKQAFADNEAHATFSAHASVLAVLAGVVADESLPAVRAHVSKQWRSIFVNGYNNDSGAYLSPHFAYYAFEGLFRLGLGSVVLSLVRQGWGWMLAQGLVTCPEFFSLEASQCHAWSGSPTWFLSRYVLGVSYPDAPDYRRVVLDIADNDLEWAEGVVPHPLGKIEIRWKKQDGRVAVERIVVPVGVRWELK